MRGVCLLHFLYFVSYIMANFNLFDDDDYGDMFIIQTPREDKISLEENDEESEFYMPEVLDISDDETDSI